MVAIELDTKFHLRRAHEQLQKEKEQQAKLDAANELQQLGDIKQVPDSNEGMPTLERMQRTALIISRGFAVGGTANTLEYRMSNMTGKHSSEHRLDYFE